MFSFKWKKTGIIAGIFLSLVLAGCGQDDANGDGEETESSTSAEMNYTITGLEPGAGQTEVNEQAIEQYESLAGWNQQTSSTGAMLTALETAMSNEEPIMITAWSPHFMFARWDIKYLDDPEGLYGEEVYGATIVREGLQDDMSNAYTLFERLYWDIDVIEEALLRFEEEEVEMAVIAQEWIDDNEATVAEWAEGIEQADNTSFELGSTTWDDALFTANVTKIVLEDLGFNVTLTALDPAILFESVASGDVDGTLSPWLPTTHGTFYEAHKDDVELIGANFEGGRIGLAVPSYMEEDSLADFEPAK